jgi:oxygen-independent coproporphyrinogen-3 oxidase
VPALPVATSAPAAADNNADRPLARERAAGTPCALYVHVPFCRHKCHYCDFYSITRQTPERMRDFVRRVLREAELWHAAADTFAIDTVFLGGGTPSLLPPDAMANLLRGLADRFYLAGVDEWTVEVNPATADAATFDLYRRCGVTRISLGVQSFDPGELATLERHHDPDDVPAAVVAARRAKIDRLSLDLIFAVPGQTPASLGRSLDAAVATNVGHVSCYGLTYEPNTPLAVRRRLGRIEAIEEEAEIGMFRQVRQRLAAAGYAAYELSNFARPTSIEDAGGPCRHNLHYWTGDDYVGLGPSAASHIAGVRWRNDPHLGRWERSIDDGDLPAIELERLDADARARELAWLNLRQSRGIRVADFRERTGVNPLAQFADVLDRLTPPGLLEVDDEGVRLSDRGLIVADAVASEFLADLE